ncbi:hypothetical protein [Acidianus ambivalens]|uniref:DUF973 family protein n=1 Tax=Acidianus ambivalens TaxID=2283 RepID=A0A650CVX5_ACIAM|nr:hypothetical protein [Acidianus ambivalens]MQL56553.1 hypothetical protein [Acidianus ambivalens]QGR21923.1 hypothetical protein D1866_07840 [Acidianus ambivalens]
MISRNLFKGNLVSMTASVFILTLLVLLDINGINYAFSKVSQVIMWIIWFLSIPSYLSYRSSLLERGEILEYLAPIAIVITFVGLIFLSVGKFLGIELIVFGYIFEPIAGVSIFLTLKKVSVLFSSLFFYGAIVFTAGLPLFLINLGIISIIGDIIKMFGLAYFIYKFK